jgi:hypothetical protein
VNRAWGAWLIALATLVLLVLLCVATGHGFLAVLSGVLFINVLRVGPNL